MMRRTVFFVPAHNTRRNKTSVEADFFIIVHIFFRSKSRRRTDDTSDMYLEDLTRSMSSSVRFSSIFELFLLRLDLFFVIIVGFCSTNSKKIDDYF